MTEVYDEEVEQRNNVVSDGDFENFARQWIRVFFRDKVDVDGSVIDPEELFTQRNISLVLNTSICDGMPTVYRSIKHLAKKKKGKHPEDVELVLKLLHDLAKLSLPKTSFTGLIAMYLEICLGCKVDFNDL